VFSEGGQEEFKLEATELSSEGANAAVRAVRSTPIQVLRSLKNSNALILNAITT
jgi:hypothetical protein